MLLVADVVAVVVVKMTWFLLVMIPVFPTRLKLFLRCWPIQLVVWIDNLLEVLGLFRDPLNEVGFLVRMNSVRCMDYVYSTIFVLLRYVVDLFDGAL